MLQTADHQMATQTLTCVGNVKIAWLQDNAGIHVLKGYVIGGIESLLPCL